MLFFKGPSKLCHLIYLSCVPFQILFHDLIIYLLYGKIFKLHYMYIVDTFCTNKQKLNNTYMWKFKTSRSWQILNDQSGHKVCGFLCKDVMQVINDGTEEPKPFVIVSSCFFPVTTLGRTCSHVGNDAYALLPAIGRRGTSCYSTWAIMHTLLLACKTSPFFLLSFSFFLSNRVFL